MRRTGSIRSPSAIPARRCLGRIPPMCEGGACRLRQPDNSPPSAGRPQDLRAMPISANDPPEHLHRSNAVPPRVPRPANTDKRPGRSSRFTTTFRPAMCPDLRRLGLHGASVRSGYAADLMRSAIMAPTAAGRLVGVGPQVPIGVQRGAGAGVAHPRLHCLDVRAGSDQQRR
jgi:hypothetical protein